MSLPPLPWLPTISSPLEASPLLREDIIRLDKLIAQKDFLQRNKLDTTEQLATFKEEAQKQLSFYEEARGQVRLKLKRRTNTPEIIKTLRSELSDLTAQMRSLRRDISMCDDVSEQSRIMKEKLKIIAEIERERSEQEQKKKSRPRRSGRGC